MRPKPVADLTAPEQVISPQKGRGKGARLPRGLHELLVHDGVNILADKFSSFLPVVQDDPALGHTLQSAIEVTSFMTACSTHEKEAEKLYKDIVLCDNRVCKRQSTPDDEREYLSDLRQQVKYLQFVLGDVQKRSPDTEKIIAQWSQMKKAIQLPTGILVSVYIEASVQNIFHGKYDPLVLSSHPWPPYKLLVSLTTQEERREVGKRVFGRGLVRFMQSMGAVQKKNDDVLTAMKALCSFSSDDKIEYLGQDDSVEVTRFNSLVPHTDELWNSDRSQQWAGLKQQYARLRKDESFTGCTKMAISIRQYIAFEKAIDRRAAVNQEKANETNKVSEIIQSVDHFRNPRVQTTEIDAKLLAKRFEALCDDLKKSSKADPELQVLLTCTKKMWAAVLASVTRFSKEMFDMCIQMLHHSAGVPMLGDKIDPALCKAVLDIAGLLVKFDHVSILKSFSNVHPTCEEKLQTIAPRFATVYQHLGTMSILIKALLRLNNGSESNPDSKYNEMVQTYTRFKETIGNLPFGTGDYI